MSQPVCYMRYGNAGQLYRTCNDNFGSSGPPKPPAVFTPLITPQEFADKIGKTYDAMSSSQKQNYHRLASAISMREKREEQRKQKTMNEKEYKEYLQSKREDTRDNRKNKILMSRKLKEEKDLKRTLRQEGANISDKNEANLIYEKIKAIHLGTYFGDIDNILQQSALSYSKFIGLFTNSKIVLIFSVIIGSILYSLKKNKY